MISDVNVTVSDVSLTVKKFIIKKGIQKKIKPTQGTRGAESQVKVVLICKAAPWTTWPINCYKKIECTLKKAGLKIPDSDFFRNFFCPCRNISSVFPSVS